MWVTPQNISFTVLPKETPTLLHFAAYYDLKKLAKALLKCPGAKEALTIKNCHGNGPVGVAKLRKNEEMEQLLQDRKVGVIPLKSVVWCGVVWCGVVWCGVVWCGVVWCGVVWCGVVWCGVVWCGVVWCGVVWCGVVWCGVVWFGMVWYSTVLRVVVWYSSV